MSEAIAWREMNLKIEGMDGSHRLKGVRTVGVDERIKDLVDRIINDNSLSRVDVDQQPRLYSVWRVKEDSPPDAEGILDGNSLNEHERVIDVLKPHDRIAILPNTEAGA